jgi:mRNA interferase RelE/StbE
MALYRVRFKSKAIKDLQSLPDRQQTQITAKIELLQDNLTGDVKKLKDFTPEYRLRVGRYRVLFELQSANVIMVYRVIHRKDAYR